MNFFDLIKDQAESFLNDNDEVKPEQNNPMLQEVEQTLTQGLQNMEPGQLENLKQEAANGTLNENSPEVQGFSSQLTDNFMNKFGLSGGAAKGLVASILPMILGKLMGNKANGNTGGGLDLDGILGGLMGGNKSGGSNANGGIMDQLSNIGKQFGLDKDGDGDVDLNDIKKMF